MIITKGMIAFVLGSGFISSAIIYDGIAHRHHEAATLSQPPVEQQQPPPPTTPKPAAGTPATDPDQTGSASDPNTDPSADPDAQQNQDSAAGQDASGDPNQNVADGQPDSGEPDQAAVPATVIQRHVAVYSAPVVRVRKAAVIHVVRLAPALPVETTAYVASASVALPAIVLPTGTPITLRLSEPLGSTISQPDQSFSATLDRDVTLDGKTVIAAGAPVNGKVVLARPAGALAGEASLQLQVTSLNLSNQQVVVHTAIRTFGPTLHGKTKVRRFMSGLVKRVEGQEHEVVLEEQTAYTFTLVRPLQVR
jgi:hypothetical protein